MKTADDIVRGMTPEQQRDYRFLRGVAKSVEDAVIEGRRRQGLADVARMERWLADVQRVERLLAEAETRRQP